MRCTSVALAGILAAAALLATPVALSAQTAEPDRGVVLAAGPPQAVVPRTDYALIIGVDRYEHFPRLSNPVHDATELEGELKKFYGFDTTLLADATESAILDAFKKMALRTYGPQDQVFIFYAGHGEVDDVDEGYITGTDSVPHGDGGKNSLSHAYLQRIVSKIPAQHVFLVLDSCFSGTFDPRIAGAVSRSAYDAITSPELLARNLGLSARLWLTSGRNEAVSDGIAGQGSPFARMMLEALRTYGGDSGVVTTANIFSAAQSLKTLPAWGELPNHAPGGQFVFAVHGAGNVARPKPLTALERERPNITTALERLRTAYRDRSIDALSKVYPGIGPDERIALQKAFTRDCRAYDVSLGTPEILITSADGTSAQVTVESTYSCTPVTGQRVQRANTRDVFQMRKVGNDWQIAATSSTVSPAASRR